MKKFLELKLNWEGYTTYLIVDPDEQGCVSISNYENDTWVHSLYVNEHYRQQGLANELLCTADKYATHFPINVATLKGAPQWLIDYYKRRNYLVHIDAEN